jgi:hypothetical protein
MTTLLLLLQLSFLNPGIPTDIDSSADKVAVEAAVVTWADQIFLNHSNYKFEQFKAFYTDDYFIQTMRIELYEEKIETLEQKKANGTYNGTDENYNADITKLSGAIEKAKAAINTMDRVSYFQIHFWSNIQTQDGITVYYELNMKLNNDYQVIEAIENSSIGKKNQDSKIAYKPKNSAPVKVIEK